MPYWLMKSEPNCFSIDDLAQRPQQTEPWDGVRNYQARNFLRAMQYGDLAFFYHSSCAHPGIMGLMKIVRTAYPDDTAFDPMNPHYDPNSSHQPPRWFCVDVKLIEKWSTPISLVNLKKQSKLANMTLLKKGNRLSIMPVTEQEWQTILSLR